MESGSRDSTERFAGLAAGYDRYRPNYPAAAIDYIMSHCGLRPGVRAVDIGSGTGISSRLLAARGLEVIGIEPNADMRRVAEATPCVSGPKPAYRAGKADAMGLTDNFAALIFAAQAFHWFANDAALREFRRVLAPGAWVALIWNELDREDAFTAAYVAALVRHSPEPAIAGQIQSASGDVLLTSPLFEQQQRIEFAHEQAMDGDALLGRAFSASYAPRDGAGREALEADLNAAFARHQQHGRAMMKYQTVLYLAQKHSLV